MTAAMAASGRRYLYLTKSLFQKACECPQKLRYHLLNQHHDYMPQKPMDPFLATLAEHGHRVGAYARAVVSSRHPNAVVDLSSTNKSLPQVVQETHAWLEEDNDGDPKIILEGAIQSGSCLIRADILEIPTCATNNNNNKELHLKEVKAKAWTSSLSREEQLLGKRGGVQAAFLPYLLDVAFQKFVVQRAFPAWTVTAHLVLPDKSKINTQIPNLNGSFHLSKNGPIGLDHQAQQWIRDAALGGEHLLATVDVDDIVTDLLQGNLVFPGSVTNRREGKPRPMTFQEAVLEWELLVESINKDSANDDMDATKPMQAMCSSKMVPPIGSHCKSCEFRTSADLGTPSGFHQCWQQATGLTEGKLVNGGNLVLDLFYGGRSVSKFLDQEKYFLSDLTNADLGLNEDGSTLEKKKKKVNCEDNSVKKMKGNDSPVATGMTTVQRQSCQISDETHGDKKPPSPYTIDKEYLSSEMDSWKFPYHFIDFETSAPALPYSIGRKPFDVLCFQFSHHVLYQDGRLEHATEFIHAVPGECPNEPFVVALSESMEKYNKGTVFRWASHENTVLTALLEKQSHNYSLNTTAHLEPLLNGGERSMVDLAKVAAKCFYASGSDGSSSLKKVLLPTMAASERLKLLYEQPTYNGINFTNQQWWQPSEVGTDDQQENSFRVKNPYSLLAVNAGDNGQFQDGDMSVADGGDAIAAYDALQRADLNPNVRAHLENSLLRYCELDTLAMVMVVQAWQEFLGV